MADTGLAQILEELNNCGVRLSVDRTGGLRIHPATKLAIGLLSAIRAHKREIVAHLRRATASSVLSASPLLGSGCSAGEQLTAMQRAIWLTCQIEPDSI